MLADVTVPAGYVATVVLDETAVNGVVLAVAAVRLVLVLSAAVVVNLVVAVVVFNCGGSAPPKNWEST